MSYSRLRGVDTLLDRGPKPGVGPASRALLDHNLIQTSLGWRFQKEGTEVVIFSLHDHRTVAVALVLGVEAFRIKGDSMVCRSKYELLARAHLVDVRRRRIRDALLAERRDAQAAPDAT